jgi:hypothetical protein
MTREEKVAWLESLPGEMISPRQLAKVTGGDPYYYNLAAREGKLNLPHEWHGTWLRIWKQPVIKLISG